MATPRTSNPTRDRSYDDSMAETFQADPAYAIEMMNSILEDVE